MDEVFCESLATAVLGDTAHYDVNYINLLRELMQLEEREVFILVDRMEPSPLTLREIGEEMGLSGERIRQIESKALRRLRKNKAGFAQSKGG